MNNWNIPSSLESEVRQKMLTAFTVASSLIKKSTAENIEYRHQPFVNKNGSE
jgi:hypothetical protein